MEVISSNVKGQSAFVFLDDVVFICGTAEPNITNAWKIESLLKSTKATLKLVECSFCANIVNYLGHVLRSIRQKLAFCAAKAIQNRKKPTVIIDLRSVLWLCSVFCQLIFDSAWIETPDTQQLKIQGKAIQPTSWNVQHAIKIPNAALIAPPVLALSFSKDHFIKEKDACNVQTSLFFCQFGGQIHKTDRLLILVADENSIAVWYNTNQLHGNCRNRTFHETKPQKKSFLDTKWSQRSQVGSQPYRLHKTTRTVALHSIWI